ncbi:MAG: TIGR02281 family clan AA aspartic protease [Hyphomicrobium sp.]
MLGWLTLIVAVLAGLFVFFQHNAGVLDAASAGMTAAGVIGLLVALYVGAYKNRGQLGRGPLIAGAITLVFAAVAGLWWFAPVQLQGMFGGASPETAGNASGRSGARQVSVLIRRDPDGKFIAQGQLNGVATTFLIDTGATAAMIKQSDAEKAGIDVSALTFTTPVQTANGTVYAAPVRLRRLTIGALNRDDIEALVAQPGTLNENLLGMSFLRRLTSYDLNGDFLTLRD